MTKHVCFIDKNGMVGTCPYPESRCDYCPFKELYEGSEEEFEYVAWISDSNENKERNCRRSSSFSETN